MKDIYQNIFIKTIDKALDNPDHKVSLSEICEILLEEHIRVLRLDQADMHGIELETVDIQRTMPGVPSSFPRGNLIKWRV